ncbi:hypothetical protein Agub_g6775 [Astrephomene gubernaculifera]|uniref:Uncharacterized protein n=1 Tax=Astrephomene gubernaculifera TaxID=47775 RepID=A0AAD3DP02_9CHLO|nr:hypothetical protein Agub_g6775 [Astrephomene gubernaculifera]
MDLGKETLTEGPVRDAAACCSLGRAGTTRKVPDSVSVTVAVRAPDEAEEDDDGQEATPQGRRRGRERFVAGQVRGTFHPDLYLSQQDCIMYKGKRVGRSKFERLGNSSMAKWYRSIRVIHDDGSLEPLGEWLLRHGLPVLKGKHRVSRKRAANAKETADDDAAEAGCDDNGDADGGSDASGGEDSAWTLRSPPSGRRCRSRRGGGGGAVSDDDEASELPNVRQLGGGAASVSKLVRAGVSRNRTLRGASSGGHKLHSAATARESAVAAPAAATVAACGATRASAPMSAPVGTADVSGACSDVLGWQDCSVWDEDDEEEGRAMDGGGGGGEDDMDVLRSGGISGCDNAAKAMWELFRDGPVVQPDFEALEITGVADAAAAFSLAMGAPLEMVDGVPTLAPSAVAVAPKALTVNPEPLVEFNAPNSTGYATSGVGGSGGVPWSHAWSNAPAVSGPMGQAGAHPVAAVASAAVSADGSSFPATPFIMVQQRAASCGFPHMPQQPWPSQQQQQQVQMQQQAASMPTSGSNRPLLPRPFQSMTAQWDLDSGDLNRIAEWSISGPPAAQRPFAAFNSARSQDLLQQQQQQHHHSLAHRSSGTMLSSADHSFLPANGGSCNVAGSAVAPSAVQLPAPHNSHPHSQQQHQQPGVQPSSGGGGPATAGEMFAMQGNSTFGACGGMASAGGISVGFGMGMGGCRGGVDGPLGSSSSSYPLQPGGCMAPMAPGVQGSVLDEYDRCAALRSRQAACVRLRDYVPTAGQFEPGGSGAGGFGAAEGAAPWASQPASYGGPSSTESSTVPGPDRRPTLHPSQHPHPSPFLMAFGSMVGRHPSQMPNHHAGYSGPASSCAAVHASNGGGPSSGGPVSFGSSVPSPWSSADRDGPLPGYAVPEAPATAAASADPTASMPHPAASAAAVQQSASAGGVSSGPVRRTFSSPRGWPHHPYSGSYYPAFPPYAPYPPYRHHPPPPFHYAVPQPRSAVAVPTQGMPSKDPTGQQVAAAAAAAARAGYRAPPQLSMMRWQPPPLTVPRGYGAVVADESPTGRLAVRGSAVTAQHMAANACAAAELAAATAAEAAAAAVQAVVLQSTASGGPNSAHGSSAGPCEEAVPPPLTARDSAPYDRQWSSFSPPAPSPQQQQQGPLVAMAVRTESSSLQSPSPQSAGGRRLARNPSMPLAGRSAGGYGMPYMPQHPLQYEVAASGAGGGLVVQRGSAGGAAPVTATSAGEAEYGAVTVGPFDAAAATGFHASGPLTPTRSFTPQQQPHWHRTWAVATHGSEPLGSPPPQQPAAQAALRHVVSERHLRIP